MIFNKPILSKSAFIKGFRCDKSLYLHKQYYNWQDQVSEQQQSVFDRGHRVGSLAQSMFPGGIDASYPGFNIFLKMNLYIDDKSSASVAYENLFEEKDMIKIKKQ